MHDQALNYSRCAASPGHPWLIALLAGTCLVGGCSREQTPPAAEKESPWIPVMNGVAFANIRFVFPTDQQQLLGTNCPGVFQPAASGKPESACFGSVRTEVQGKRLVSKFHEGIDIAATRRAPTGCPLDRVYAAADGVVAYVNRIAGNSNYGRYAVLVHADPLGEIYTLYAHLAAIAPGLKAGMRVQAGETIGTMGNSSSAPIPMPAAHLHFEIGLIANARFAQWFKAQKLKPDHGVFNGWNFYGVDPLKVLAGQENNPTFAFEAYLETIPRAFEIVLKASRPPDFFRRYPALWQGAAFNSGAMTLACSENGLPLSGRNASAAEAQALGRRSCLVQNIDATALGRNGCHLVVSRAGGWKLGRDGERWLEILMY